MQIPGQYITTSPMKFAPQMISPVTSPSNVHMPNKAGMCASPLQVQIPGPYGADPRCNSPSKQPAMLGMHQQAAQNFIESPSRLSTGGLQTSGSSRAKKGGGGGQASLDILCGRGVCAKGRVHIYSPPFSPWVRYAGNAEQFLLPHGWALLRTKQGLLLWIELSEDAGLQELMLDIARSTQGTSGVSRRTSCGAMQRMSSASPPRTGGASSLTLSLPGVTRGVFGVLETRLPRTCSVEPWIKLPNDDVMVIRPHAPMKTSSEVGSTVRLFFASDQAGNKAIADDQLKAWLSTWEVEA